MPGTAEASHTQFLPRTQCNRSAFRAFLFLLGLVIEPLPDGIPGIDVSDTPTSATLRTVTSVFLREVRRGSPESLLCGQVGRESVGGKAVLSFRQLGTLLTQSHRASL